MGGEGGPRGDAIDNGDDEFAGSWNDGGVASGSVVKRIPVDTVHEISSVSAEDGQECLILTPSTLLLCAEVQLSAR